MCRTLCSVAITKKKKRGEGEGEKKEKKGPVSRGDTQIAISRKACSLDRSLGFHPHLCIIGHFCRFASLFPKAPVLCDPKLMIWFSC